MSFGKKIEKFEMKFLFLVGVPKEKTFFGWQGKFGNTSVSDVETDISVLKNRRLVFSQEMERLDLSVSSHCPEVTAWFDVDSVKAGARLETELTRLIISFIDNNDNNNSNIEKVNLSKWEML